MNYLDDFAMSFWILFNPFLTWLAAAMSVAGLFLAAFKAIVTPVRRV